MDCAKAAQVLLFSVMAAMCSVAAAFADDQLKTINDADGGKIIYGQVQGQTTEAGAMGSVLRQIRGTWGDEPQVGKFFRVRDTDSMAVFFTGVNHARQDAHLAGLVIVSQVTPQRVDAAVLTNDVERFGGTVNSMLAELFKEWHPVPASSSSAAENAPSVTASTPAPVATLRHVTLPDGSASASIPEGWQVAPGSGGGTMTIEGPKGERVSLGFTLNPMNTNDPRTQKMMMFARGAGRNTGYAHALYYPYGADMAKTFVDLMKMYRQSRGLEPAEFQISSETNLPAPAGYRRVYLTGHVDAHDGVGMREMNTTFTCSPPGPVGGFMTYTNHAAVPVQFADQERETMLAVIASYSVNQQVVSSQAAAFAAPEIARIHEIGRRAAAQAASAHAMEDAHNAAIERKWDNDDKRSQSFSNYLLDQSVITDNQGNHATVWNQTADALVRSNPQRYEYVATPNLRKGVDY